MFVLNALIRNSLLLIHHINIIILYISLRLEWTVEARMKELHIQDYLN